MIPSALALPWSWPLPLISDYTREAEKPFAATLASTVTYGVVSCWMYLIGMGAAIYTGQSDIAQILLQAGLGVVGLLIVVTWQLSGYMMVIYIAQLQNIPDNLLEAAEIDGANSWQKLRSITLPLVAPAFTVGLFLSLSNCFKLYDQNLALTNGGPFDSTEMIALNIYNTAFRYNDLGLAQAKAVIFLVIVAAIGLTQLYFSKRKEVEM